MAEKEEQINRGSVKTLENVYMTLLLYMFKISILSPIKKRKPDTNPSIFITLTPTRKTTSSKTVAAMILEVNRVPSGFGDLAEGILKS